MNSKKIILVLITVGLVISLWAYWMNIARERALWNDELYSQTSSIATVSYLDMMKGKIQEGNVAPLFYMMQKVMQDLVHYQTPPAWKEGQWAYHHPASQYFLRILPVACMAIAVGLFFYFFATRFVWWAGLYALAIALSSFMVWSYAMEARPYALWFLLSTLQLMLFTDIAAKGAKAKNIAVLAIVNLLLSFTVVFSLVQNVAVSLLLFIVGHRAWRSYLLLFILPSAISLYYYFHSPTYKFFLAESFMQLLGASLPVDRILIILMGFAIWLLLWFWPKQPWFVPVSRAALKQWAAMMGLTAIIFAGCWAILYKFKMGQTPDKEGFQVSNRYFMGLAPIAIAMTTLASLYLATLPKGWLRNACWGILSALLLYRLSRTFILVVSL